MKVFDPSNCSDGDSGGGDGVDTFIELTDTPSGYGGQANKTVVVNPTGTGLTFTDSAGGGGTNNVFKINAGQEYTVVDNQELVSTGLFYLDGQMNLNGKWCLLGESVDLTGSSFGADDHTHSDLLVLADLNLVLNVQGSYEQHVYHTLQGFPLLKFLGSGLREMDPHIRHVSIGHFIVESNIPLTGKIYALHSTQTRVPVLFGALNLQAVGNQYEQVLTHNANSFPFFKIMDGFGTELQLEVQHINSQTTKILSNVFVTGQIYML